MVQDSLIVDRDAGMVDLGEGQLLVSWFTSDTRRYAAAARLPAAEPAAWTEAFAGWTDAMVEAHPGSWVMLSEDRSPTQFARICLHRARHRCRHPRSIHRLRLGGMLATAKARDEGPKEDFAESVAAVLWDGYAVNDSWTDDRGLQPDATWALDRYDYVEVLFDRPSAAQPAIR